MIEDEKTEFKREFTPEIKKEVIAFANTSGGTIYIGIDDDGKPYALPNPDEVLLRITNSIRESIQPDVTMFVRYDMTEQGIKITVREGTNKPYYLAEKGLKPSGVYVRQGASSVPASLEAIRQMIKLTGGGKFETERSLTQELTFQAASAEFSKRGVDFEESQKRTLGLKNREGLCTTLGLLLSDQCTHTIKVACFSGIEKGEFKSRKEFGGSLLQQLHSAYEFISLSNNLKATFSGLDRIEQYDYPEEAIREALLNAIIHRDYSYSGSIIVNIYDDRMEFVSLGGLMPGLNEHDIVMGISQPRNEKLANIFYRLKHIEAYGTGLKKIMRLYKEQERRPVITVSDHVFVIEIPNTNYAPKNNSDIFPLPDSGALYVSEPVVPYGVSRGTTYARPLKKQHQAVLDYLRDTPGATSEDIQKLLTVKQTRSYGIIKEMIHAGLIEKSGNGTGYVQR
jgi:ATP-dependent DNA helicase RecG